MARWLETGVTTVPEHAAEILVVDDDEGDRALALAAFARIHPAPRVVVVDGGKAAIEYLHGSSRSAGRAGMMLPRLVVLDINMPEMSGLEVLRRVRAHPATEDMAVVILTGSYDPEEIDAAMKLGATSYFLKPGDLQEYMEMLRVIRDTWP